MKSRARVRATLGALAATATAALLISATAAQAAPVATPAPTRTTLSANPPSIPFGAVAHLKAVVKPVLGSGQPPGTVTFSENGTPLTTVALVLVGTVETAKLQVPGLTLGDHDFTAHYNGSGTFAASTSLPLTVTVGPAVSITTLTTSTKTVELNLPAKLKAVVKAKVAGTGSPSGGTVTFREGTTVLGGGPVPLALVGSLWTAKLNVPNLSLGDHIFTATFDGSADLAVSVSKDLTVTDTKAATTTTGTAAPAAGGNTKLTAIVKAVVFANGTPGDTGTVTFVIDNLAPQTFQLNSFGKAVLITTSPLAPGAHTVKMTYSGDASFTGSTTTLPFNV
jgi:hypothetical protein